MGIDRQTDRQTDRQSVRCFVRSFVRLFVILILRGARGEKTKRRQKVLSFCSFLLSRQRRRKTREHSIQVPCVLCCEMMRIATTRRGLAGGPRATRKSKSSPPTMVCCRSSGVLSSPSRTIRGMAARGDREACGPSNTQSRIRRSRNRRAGRNGGGGARLAAKEGSGDGRTTENLAMDESVEAGSVETGGGQERVRDSPAIRETPFRARQAHRRSEEGGGGERGGRQLAGEGVGGSREPAQARDVFSPHSHPAPTGGEAPKQTDVSRHCSEHHGQVCGASRGSRGVRRPLSCVRHRFDRRRDLHVHRPAERTQHEREHPPKLRHADPQWLQKSPSLHATRRQIWHSHHHLCGYPWGLRRQESGGTRAR